MFLKQVLWVGALAGALCGNAIAAVTAEEAAHLGKDLTPWGAEVAGSKDGLIPAYTGGQKPPSGFNPDGGPKRWIDPYSNEKPVVTITAENMSQYEDKLLGSAKELFKRYPKTFKMEVYPTHRSVWFPEWVTKEMEKNATQAKIMSNGYSLAGAFGGTPFPIPKSGMEVWWNHELRYKGPFHENNVETWMVDGDGRKSLNAAFRSSLYYPVFDSTIGRDKFLAGEQLYYKVYNDYTEPASRVGEVTLYWTWFDNDKHKAAGWIYTPGTRRVRTTPDLFYDTPCPGYNGGITMDDIQMTYGPQDRFDWKLIGKKEVIVPYNNYTQQFKTPAEHTLTPHFPNPEDIRWEVHRVWVIEGTPKQGVRHIYSKKIVYLDEDQGTSAMETYDHAGKIFRAGWDTTVMLYDIGVPYTLGNFFFDFSTGSYWMGSHPGDPAVFGLKYPNGEGVKRASLEVFTPEYLQANGVR